MMRKIPIVATPIDPADLFSGFKSRGAAAALRHELGAYLSLKHLCLLNSGTNCFFTILQVLQGLSGKKEVILPAYTASPLLLAVQRAGLKPVLCDISCEDFGLDAGCLADALTADTLCITAVHLFGIISSVTKNRFPGIWLLEDCAQALGSTTDKRPAGGAGDVSFFSFARGKNLPTYGGGCIATNNAQLAKELEYRAQHLPGQSLFSHVSIPLELAVLSLIVKPGWYGLLSPFVSGFKEQAPHPDFTVRHYTNFQAAVALSVLARIEKLSQARYHNGMTLLAALAGRSDVAVPRIPEDSRPAFNRLPVLFRDKARMKSVRQKLSRAGIEASPMYPRALHHQFELGFKREAFPNACYVAEHILTLPVHPFVTGHDIDVMSGILLE